MLFAVCASLATAAGMLLLKIGIIKEESSTSSSRYSYLLKVWWLSGIFFLLGGQVFNALVLKYGNVILMSQTSPFTIIHTAYLSPFVLGESFFWCRDGVTIFIIGVGSYVEVTPPHQVEAHSTKDTVV